VNGAPSAADIAAIRQTYVRGMERFANGGLMLAEQVWDGVGNPTAKDYAVGQNTDSATPLAWTHAEYLKLLRSLADGKVWDRYDPVETATPAERKRPRRSLSGALLDVLGFRRPA
jgi:glucoamylase